MSLPTLAVFPGGLQSGIKKRSLVQSQCPQP